MDTKEYFLEQLTALLSSHNYYISANKNRFKMKLGKIKGHEVIFVVEFGEL